MNLQEMDQAYIASTYRRFPLHLVRGKGSLLEDDAGHELIDLGTGIAVNSMGIADDLWCQAVIDQLTTLQHTSNLYYTDPCVRLAQMLCERTGMKKVFFSNSGAEANECAIKAARKWAAETHDPDCYTIATLNQSFHGRTLTTLAATGQSHYHELFQPLTPGFVSFDAQDLGQLEALAHQSSLAAVMIECIQGEGGVIALAPDTVRNLAAFCKARNILLIVDEVQTGNGRTGKLYSYMHFGIQPDLVTTAKGLGGGLPLGATLLGEKVQNVFTYGDHGSTFGGNPVCCAGAVSVLSRIDDTLLNEVEQKGLWIREKLLATEGVEEVTGLGLMIGIRTRRNAADVVNEAMQRGVLCLTAKDRVRLLPALNIPMSVLQKAIDILCEVIAS